MFRLEAPRIFDDLASDVQHVPRHAQANALLEVKRVPGAQDNGFAHAHLQRSRFGGRVIHDDVLLLLEDIDDVGPAPSSMRVRRQVYI